MITMQRFLLSGLLLSIGMSIALAAEPKPGTYIRDHNMGTLDIRRDASNKLLFEIHAIGGNGHICTPAGTIEGAVGRTAEEDPEFRCEIAFDSKGTEIVVNPITDDACRQECGARGWFDGIYRAPPANCTVSARQAQEDTFLVLYRARQYTKAGKVLDDMVARCEIFMSSMEFDKLNNDLALSQYHNGQYAQCLATINKTTAGEVRDEQELKASLTPFDFDNHIDIAKATWFNRGLCVKALEKKTRPSPQAPQTTAR